MKRGKRRQERLGEKMRAIRLALRMSQGQMIKHLEMEADLDRSDISGYERGKREPSLYLILKYAEAAGVCADILINDSLDLPKKLPSIPKHKP